ncbi:MAG: hypothetical protein ACJ76Y_26980 [Thermoanaerobaculia bacterium]
MTDLPRIAWHLAPGRAPESLLDAAVAAGVLDPGQAALVREAAEARRDAVAVDSFTLEDYLGLADTPPPMAATA